MGQGLVNREIYSFLKDSFSPWFKITVKQIIKNEIESSSLCHPREAFVQYGLTGAGFQIYANPHESECGVHMQSYLYWMYLLDFRARNKKTQSMRHTTNHKRTRQLNFTEVLMWLIILGELLESHGKITSSAVSKKNGISSLCYRGKLGKKKS